MQDSQDGVIARTGGVGSGNCNNASSSACDAPCANFFACCRLIYCIISSSPAASSSSTVGAGLGVLVLAEILARLGVALPRTLGDKSFKPLLGLSALKR